MNFRKYLRSISETTASTFTSRIGLHLVYVGDAVAIGQYSSGELGWFGIAIAVSAVLFILGPGLMIGCLVNSSYARANKNYTAVGEYWRVGVFYGIIVGIVCGLICLAGSDVLRLFGQSDEVSDQAGGLLVWLGAAMPFHLAYIATLFVLEAVGKQRDAAIVFFLAAIVNALLNLVLVPETAAGLAAEGALMGTIVVRAGILAALVTILLSSPSLRIYRFLPFRRPNPAVWREIVVFGLAGGISLVGETAAFASLTLFAGWMGGLQLTVYTILFNILTLCFMMALAVGVATNIAVSAARAENDRRVVVSALKAGLFLTLGIMCFGGAVSLVFATTFSSVFSADEIAVLSAAGLMVWVSFMCVADGTQVTMLYAVRAMGDKWIATGLHLVCYLGVMTGLAWLCGYYLEQGIAGLFLGGIVASILAVGLQWYRFRILLHRMA